MVRSIAFHALSLAFLISASVGAQSDAVDRASAWLRSTSDRLDLESVRTAIAALPIESKSEYLGLVVETIHRGQPSSLVSSARRGIFAVHRDLLSSSEYPVIDSAHFAGYLLRGQSGEGAIEALDFAEELAARNEGVPEGYASHLVGLRIDSLLLLERPAEACKVLAEARAASSSPFQRARLLAQEATILSSLGKLDLASLRIAEAKKQLDNTTGDNAQLERLRFELLLRELDVYMAREQYPRARRADERFRRARAEAGRPLDPRESRLLQVRQLTAEYLGTQSRPTETQAVRARIEAALSDDTLQPHGRDLLATLVVDLDISTGRLSEAQERLQQLERDIAERDAGAGRIRWRLAPIASRLARARGIPSERTARTADLNRVLDEMIEEWRRAPVDEDGTGFMRIGSRMRVVGELVTELVAASDVEAALATVLAVQNCTTLARREGIESPTITNLQAWLAQTNAAAWILVPAWHESHAFLVDGATIRHAPITRACELRGATKRLLDELAGLSAGEATSRAVEQTRRACREAARLMLPAQFLSSIANVATLHCVGSGLVGGLPIPCLELPDGRRLGETVAVSSTSSLPLIAMRAERAVASPTDEEIRALLLATLTPGPEFCSRVGLDAQASAPAPWAELVEAMPARHIRLLDQDATVPALRAALGGPTAPFDLAVLVAHGEGAVAGRNAGLGLTPSAGSNGELRASMLTGTRLGSAVVLAACSTAHGPQRVGDDDAGGAIVGACLAAGSAAVVASRVRQRLGLFRKVAAQFAKAVDDGSCAAEALRLARLSIQADGTAASLAAAQIELFGDGSLRLRTPQGTKRLRRGAWPAILVGCAVALLLAAASCVARRNR